MEEQITGLDGLNVATDVSLRIQNVAGLVHLVQDGLVLVRKDDVGLEGFDAQQGLAQRAWAFPKNLKIENNWIP